jgi:dTDP-4-amino-4,6-dideoxygalactose transaminase
MACFSFYVTKNITTGEGGALVTADPARAERARLLALHGMDRDAWKRYTEAGSWYYEVVAPGFKYNMTDLAAALGLCQLRRLAGFNARRRALAEQYDARLGSCPALRLPAVRGDVESAYHLYPLRLDLDRLTIDRARFIDALKAENIGASVHFVPVPMHPYYRDRFGFTPGMFPVTEAAYAGLVSLPLYPAMDEADVDDAAAAVLKIAAHCGG